jgi:DNA repair exonuclease SbcCD ATPase subunit
MAEMADGPSFDVVRRGYDIDQVHEFLVRQAEAWRAELYEASRRIADLESDVVRLEELETEVESSRNQQEALTMSFHSAAQARDDMLASAEADIAARKEVAAEEVTQMLAEAKAEAATILADAEREANDVRFSARARTDELMKIQESELVNRKAELDDAYNESVQKYEATKQSLADKVRELNSMREALVIGLEAIATGGLAALEDVSDQLAAVGITSGDDSAVRQLVGGEPLEEQMTNGNHPPS